jgi:GNAT superfamily N-acetyltransferase
MTYVVREVDISAVDDDTLRAMVDLINMLNVEAEPRQAPFTLEEARMFFIRPGAVQKRYALTDGDGAILGHLVHSYADDGSNPDTLRAQIGIDAEHRRAGHGTRLLSRLVDDARDLGRSKLTGSVFDTVPAAQAFAEAIGARSTLDMHVNVVKIPDLDRAMLQQWVDEGPRRAPGYSMTVYQGMVPHVLLDGVAHLHFILERDSPRPEGQQPREWTGDLVRQMYTHFLQGVDSLTAIATNDASGAPVGMSQLIRRHGDPSTWIVTVTMVDPDHRGHALGKWAKASVNLEAMEHWPGGEWQETANAFANDAMLGINYAMGFEHELTAADVEVSLADAEAYLESRS